MKMRDLEKRTGVNRETIRVYLRHGLIPEPERPKPNVALYNEDHVRSILTVRHLQKEKRLSLPLIKRAIEGDNTALPADAINAFPHLDSLIESRAGVEQRLVSLAALQKSNDYAESDAEVLASIGALDIIQYRGKAHVSTIDAQLISIWSKMREAGFTEEAGFSPTVCKMHLEAGEALAHRELNVFLRTLSGKKAADPTADMAQAALTHMIGFVGIIRLKTVINDLKSLNTSSVKTKK